MDIVNDKVKIRWRHYHSGNSTQKYRTDISRVKKTPYVTVAWVEDIDTGQVLAQGVAACSKKDQPNRHVGRQKATGRIWVAYQMTKRSWDEIPF